MLNSTEWAFKGNARDKAIFAIAFGGETLTLQKALGGVMVVIAMFVIVIKES